MHMSVVDLSCCDHFTQQSLQGCAVQASGKSSLRRLALAAAGALAALSVLLLIPLPHMLHLHAP